MTLNFSLGQWPFLMRAGIFEGKERALDVEQSNSLALDVDESSLASAISFMLATFTNSAMHLSHPEATIAVPSPSMTRQPARIPSQAANL